jgi:YHS domain-containing protein
MLSKHCFESCGLGMSDNIEASLKSYYGKFVYNNLMTMEQQERASENEDHGGNCYYFCQKFLREFPTDHEIRYACKGKHNEHSMLNSNHVVLLNHSHTHCLELAGRYSKIMPIGTPFVDSCGKFNLIVMKDNELNHYISLFDKKIQKRCNLFQTVYLQDHTYQTFKDVVKNTHIRNYSIRSEDGPPLFATTIHVNLEDSTYKVSFTTSFNDGVYYEVRELKTFAKQYKMTTKDIEESLEYVGQIGNRILGDEAQEKIEICKTYASQWLFSFSLDETKVDTNIQPLDETEVDTNIQPLDETKVDTNIQGNKCCKLS